MLYEGKVFRPPVEGRSLVIQATLGCPHNRCAFCSMYKDRRFKIRSVEDVKQDIRLAKELLWAPESLFLADGNAIAMKADRLAEIVHFCYEQFPTLRRVSCYGSAKFLLKKTDEEMQRLRQVGLETIYLGLESGDDEILAEMEKGATAAGMIEAARKVVEAGITLSVYVILGLGGASRWQRNARNTAAVLNAMRPRYVRPRTLSMAPGTRLQERLESGEFVPCSPFEIALEARELLTNLHLQDAYFLTDHITDYVQVYGELPQDKEEMLHEIDELLANPQDLEKRALMVKLIGSEPGV